MEEYDEVSPAAADFTTRASSAPFNDLSLKTLPFEFNPSEYFKRMCFENGYLHVASGRVYHRGRDESRTHLLGIGEVVATDSSYGRDRSIEREYLLIRVEGSLLLATLYTDEMNICVATADADATRASYRGQFDSLTATKPVEGDINVEFWYLSRHGGYSRQRTLTLPTWAEIKGNYNAAILDPLTALITERPSSPSGLILWTGAPGTGKTTCIRSMIREWSTWADTHVITDPESFLNDIGYLNSVVLEDGEAARGRLLILEDAGELIAADAKARAGQALSRLLNVTDGLIGQGSNTYILVTTNEPITRLHDAASRPGRCLASVEFTSLPVDAANAWLIDKGSDATVERATDLADLYAIVKGDADTNRVPRKATKAFGFNG